MGRHYQISVITPLHNVDLKIFTRTFESIKSQSFGFENIEWLVVVHNSTQEYQDSIKSMLGEYENVKIHILNNDAHTPSSPRNYALDLVTGDYVGFLDGDDKYTPDCIEEALRNIQNVGADICAFRREVELEAESHLILNEKVLWDQTQQCIVVNKHTWDDKKIFNVIWGMVTSKIYSREFLNKHNLRFDEDIFFAEDFALNVKAYGLAEKICLLPQLIGYVYFVNSASLVQAVDLPNDKLIKYAEGFKKIFDTGLNYGFNMNDVMHNLLTHEAMLMLSSKIIDAPTRKRIRELLGPYVEMMTPLPDTKLYSSQRRQELITLPRAIIDDNFNINDSFISYTRDPVPVTVKDFQALALKTVLENGERSDYGQRYGFGDIMTMEGYSSRLPLTNYDTYQPMIKLAARIGESGIFTDNEISAYFLSYGSMGVPRRLPVTKKHLNFYVDAFRKIIGKSKVLLMLESMPYKPSGLDLDNTYTNTLMGLILSEIYNAGITNLNDRLNIINPSELLFPDEVLNAVYPRLLFALRERDLEMIYAPSALIMLYHFELMYEQWDRLCDDIEAGHISETARFPEELREALNRRISPDKKRADELRTINLNSENAIKHIWPSMKKFVCNCSGPYMIYANQLRKYVADVSLENAFFATTEAFIANVNNDKFELSLSSAFFEFIPDEDSSKILYAHQLKKGSSYRIIVSTLSGLYRYLTPLVIKVEEITKNSLLFSLTGRQNQIYRGINEDNINEAIDVCCNELGIYIRDYVFFCDDDDDIYDLILELTFIKSVSEENLHRVEGIVSDILKCKVRISFNEPKTHQLYREILQYKRNVLPDAIQPVHITDNPRAIKFFRKMTIKEA